MEIPIYIFNNVPIVKDSRKLRVSLNMIFITFCSKICILLRAPKNQFSLKVATLLHLVIWPRYQRIIGDLSVGLTFAIYFMRPFYLLIFD